MNTRQHGFTMIEVLISILILAVGLLGMSAMQLTSLKVNQGAYNRSQANILAADILDRMRANPVGFDADGYDSFDTREDNVPSNQSCITTSTGCTGAQIADQDFREWAGYFVDVQDLGDDYVPLMPGGWGQVSVDADGNATVTIGWSQESWVDDGEGNISRDTDPQTLTIVVRI